MTFENIPITSMFSIHIITHPKDKLSPSLEAQIEQIWQNEIELRGKALFNGRIFNLVSLEKDRLVGKFIDYKTYLAAMRDPEIAKLTQIKSVGMTGMTFSGDKVLIGKRAGHVTLYPNFYEFAPAGTIDPGSQDFDHVDVNRQILSELVEETGVSEKEVNSVLPVVIIRDLNTGDLEIGIRITLASSVEDHKLNPTEEYPELLWVDLKDLPAFLEENRDKFVPISAHLASFI